MKNKSIFKFNKNTVCKYSAHDISEVKDAFYKPYKKGSFWVNEEQEGWYSKSSFSQTEYLIVSTSSSEFTKKFTVIDGKLYELPHIWIQLASGTYLVKYFQNWEFLKTYIFENLSDVNSDYDE